MARLKKAIAELIGTFALVFFGCGAAVTAGMGSGATAIDVLGISFAFGLAIVAMAYGIGPVSGCHVNPAVSFGVFVAGRMSAGDMIGYWIAQGFRGRGIVTDACRAVIDYAFLESKLNRVEIHCAAGNEKSCAIPQRLGFQLEGLLREAQLLNGEYQDIHVYGMLARDWTKLKR